MKHGQWSYIDSDDGSSKTGSLHCKSCDTMIERITSVYVRFITQFIRQSIDQFDSIKGEFRKSVKYPSFLTGYICKDCWNRLYQYEYTDDKGKHKIVEGLPWPNDHSNDRRSRMLSTDDGSDKPDKPNRVTRVFIDRNGEEEEWVTSLPSTEEPVDAKCYNHFMRGRR